MVISHFTSLFAFGIPFKLELSLCVRGFVELDYHYIYIEVNKNMLTKNSKLKKIAEKIYRKKRGKKNN